MKNEPSTFILIVTFIATVVGFLASFVVAFLLPFVIIWIPIAWVAQWLLLTMFGVAISLLPLAVFLWFIVFMSGMLFTRRP